MNKSAGQLKRNYPEIFRDYLVELRPSADISPRFKAALHNIPTESFEQLRLLANGERMFSVLKQDVGRPKGNGEKFSPLENAALIYLYHQASYKSDVAKNDLLKAILVSFGSGPARHLLGLAELRAKIRDWEAISLHGYDDNTLQAVLKHHGAASLVLPVKAEPEKEEKSSP